jgi:hypothetical protein
MSGSSRFSNQLLTTIDISYFTASFPLALFLAICRFSFLPVFNSASDMLTCNGINYFYRIT